MELKANNDNMFSVPCVVVDNLLQMASGDHIKVLLYILRRSGRDFAENEISDETGVCQEEVNKAIEFWRKARVLTGRQGSNAPSVRQTAEKQAIEKQTAQNKAEEKPATEENQKTEMRTREEQAFPENPPEQKKKRYKKPNLSASDIAEIKTEDPEISDLFCIIENMLGTLNITMLNLIIHMHNYLGLKKEVIVILINYCKKMNKTSPNYIEQVAYSWAEKNINTHETAEKEVERIVSYIPKVKRIFKLEDLSDEHTAMVEQWEQWEISFELVAEAYNICLKAKATGYKFDFGYANGIIKKWHEKGIKDLNGVSEENKSHKKKNTSRKKVHNDDDFDVDMYKIFINDYEVI